MPPVILENVTVQHDPERHYRGPQERGSYAGSLLTRCRSLPRRLGGGRGVHLHLVLAGGLLCPGGGRLCPVGFSNCWEQGLDRSAKLVAIHKEANHGVMPEHRLGEPDCFACEPFEASAECEMFALNLLGVDRADSVSSSGEMAVIDPPASG